VGVIDYSDYPPSAQRIPRVGSSTALDLEAIMGLRPDLIVVWLHGSGQRQLDKLLHLGIPVFYSEPRRLADIARAIEQLGRLAGSPEVIATAAVVGTAEDGLEVWRRWPHLAATERENLFRIPEDLISRHTPRILDGAQMMCEDLDVARAKRR